MKTDALNEALDLLARTRTSDLGTVDRVMKAARAELAALSAVPEDVARDHRTVRGIFAGLEGEYQSTLEALSRLATAAARVPGLESELEQVHAAYAQQEEQLRQAEAKWHESAEAATRAEAERDALAARVAELERQAEQHAKDADRAERQASENSARAEAAERRMAELEGKDAAWAREVAGLRDRVQVAEEDLDEAVDVMTEGDLARARDATPTPAPAGLLEAVEDVASDSAWLANTALRMGMGKVTLEQLQSFARAVGRAAYDAAKGERGCGPCLDGECAIHPLNDHGTPIAATADAPEPTVTHAALAAVAANVDRLLMDAYSDHALGPDATGDKPFAEAILRALVRRVTGGQVPRVLLEARVVEVLTSNSGRVAGVPSDFDSGWAACVQNTAMELGLTLDTPPSGPGGGGHKTCGMARYVSHDVGPDHRITEPCTFDEGHDGRHSWEPEPSGPGNPPKSSEGSGPGGGEPKCSLCKDAPEAECPDCCTRGEWTPRSVLVPTPTPEGPALRSASGKCLGEECTKDSPTVGAHLAECPANSHVLTVPMVAQPEPAAPEVVWQQDGSRVLADGTYQFLWAGEWQTDTVGTYALLARALAEAMREAREAVNGAGGWRDVVTAQEHLTKDAARKAAESMRERAAKAGGDGGAMYDASHGGIDHHTGPRCAAIAGAIRALPLE